MNLKRSPISQHSKMHLLMRIDFVRGLSSMTHSRNLRHSLISRHSKTHLLRLTDFVKRWFSRTHSRNLRHSLISQHSKMHSLKRIDFEIGLSSTIHSKNLRYFLRQPCSMKDWSTQTAQRTHFDFEKQIPAQTDWHFATLTRCNHYPTISPSQHWSYYLYK